jgi:(2Fe-2S) ferredoxin
LDFCENGIACVVYPDGTWYRLNTEIDIKSFIQNIKHGTADSALLMDFEA